MEGGIILLDKSQKSMDVASRESVIWNFPFSRADALLTSEIKFISVSVIQSGPNSKSVASAMILQMDLNLFRRLLISIH